MTKPFRFGVQTQGAPDGKAWRDMARRAESLGYSALWIPDHFGEQWGPIAALTAAAEATTTLRVGALVFDNDYRHPGVLAKEMATLDLLSEGRLDIGLGAGWMKSDYEEYGLPYDSPGVRISRMEEGLAIIKEFFAKDRFSFEGQHYRYTDAHGKPDGVQRPHPPILIGGGGKRVLGIAAREADIVGFNTALTAGYVGPEAAAGATAEKFHERVQWVKEAAGERFDQLELQCWVGFCFVGADRQETARNMAPLFGLSEEEVLRVPIGMAGSVDEIVETLQERREEFGFSFWTVPGDAFDVFAPVVERLAGT